jgi:hypothetical protein
MPIYSQALREKMMAAVAQDKQLNNAFAETVGISESIIEKWTRRQRETGSVAAALCWLTLIRGLSAGEHRSKYNDSRTIDGRSTTKTQARSDRHLNETKKVMCF